MSKLRSFHYALLLFGLTLTAVSCAHTHAPPAKPRKTIKTHPHGGPPGQTKKAIKKHPHGGPPGQTKKGHGHPGKRH